MRIIEGGCKWFDMTIIGGWNNRGVVFGKSEKSCFSQSNMYLLNTYENSDVTDTFTHELWLC